MENDLEPQRVEQKCRVFPLQNGDLKKCFGFSQTKLFFLVLTGPERCIFFSTCKRIFTGKPKILWGGQLYMLTAFPNGLACCPRLFTKLLKPVMAHLHMLGFVSAIFTDDTADGRLGKGECEIF